MAPGLLFVFLVRSHGTFLTRFYAAIGRVIARLADSYNDKTRKSSSSESTRFLPQVTVQTLLITKETIYGKQNNSKGRLIP